MGSSCSSVDASFQLNPGEKVGPNGAGKTTLFRMVVGEETPDEGAVSVPKKLTISYFRLGVEEMQGRSVLDEAIAGSGRVGDLHHELEALQRDMSGPTRRCEVLSFETRLRHAKRARAALFPVFFFWLLTGGANVWDKAPELLCCRRSQPFVSGALCDNRVDRKVG
jgi:ATPase subunit of ABC transporter with duplicated ATPase domains